MQNSEKYSRFFKNSFIALLCGLVQRGPGPPHQDNPVLVGQITFGTIGLMPIVLPVAIAPLRMEGKGPLASKTSKPFGPYLKSFEFQRKSNFVL